MAKPAPEVIRLSPAELDTLLAQLRTHLPSPLFEVVQAAPRTLQWALEAMELKTTTIARLKRVLFGFKSEKTKQLFPQSAPSATGATAAEPRQPIFQAMIESAAQGTLLHTDDTPMRVQSLRREIDQAGDQAERTGIFTTGLIAKLGTGQRVALYFTGSRHAGENLDHVLQHRAADLGRPLHMCDGLSRNGSKQFETILCNCATHGRRQFTDVREGFPLECRQVVEELGLVYRHDAQAREQQLSDDQHLRFHQEHSQPVMDRLHQQDG